MKQGSPLKCSKEMFPSNEVTRNDLGQVTTQDDLFPIGHSYSTTSATSTVITPSLTEQTSSRKTTDGLREQDNSGKKKTLPPLFIYIEAGDFRRAMERAKRHPRELRTWASIKIKKTSDTTKRLALHQACFKLRSASTSMVECHNSDAAGADPFIEVCRFILFLVEMYPNACKERETRHGCLPLHLAAFASCTQSYNSKGSSDRRAFKTDDAAQSISLASSTVSAFSSSSVLPSPAAATGNSMATISKPTAISHNYRSISEATARTTMTAAIAGEKYIGHESELMNEGSSWQTAAVRQQRKQTQSVSMGHSIFVSEEREEWAVKVLNALLDAYPRAIRSGSEGGRMPLHYAATGLATPRVISTLITAYPEAAKNRTKDGSLPVHLCAHWGISHPDVVVIMLKSYPDSTYGRNRWERTPLEEALCMAGENGRPNQAALVRALRKHHSFWTRPEGILFHQAHLSSRDPKHHIVDIDATVDSMEDSIHGDDSGDGVSRVFTDTRGTFGGLRISNKGNESLSATGNDLPTLIRTSNWGLAAQRLKMIPSDAKLSLRVVTSGGFTSIDGFTPLHYACERRPPKEFLALLVNLCPEAVGKRAMPGGKLPLHIACTWHASRESIEVLLGADRSTCKIPDDLGNLPIHSASFSGASAAVVEKLLKAYPKAVLSRNKHEYLPEDIVKRLKHGSRLPVLALLHLCKDEVITKRKMKHRRNRSEEYPPRVNDFDPTNCEIDNFESGEIEVTYSGESETKKELVWI
eukprot:CAMPEP_0197187024 /NCGR_PEP_ID=MMETSP1423-20130617/15078_1 /TAXON_ID=476441 /ORGANISM="Pseudo-nitzschia heimii, Strain UNC1101" /LENGTH=753 /DNA_ID=CAMNT_0042638497 /DNA_START=59 /DNA_END=2320 /DNA_ORIENTATION=-